MKKVEKEANEFLRDKIIGMYKFFDAKYIDSYQRMMRFSKVIKWQSTDLNKGQMDPYEGIFARLHKTHLKQIRELELKETNYEKQDDNEYWVYRDKKTINYFAACFYIGKGANSTISKRKKKVVVKNAISKKTINDIAGNGRVGVIKVSDPSELFKDLSQLNDIKLKKGAVLYEIPLDKDWECPFEHPFELFFKQKDILYKEQSEYRIIFYLDKKYYFDFIDLAYNKDNNCDIISLEDVNGLDLEFRFSLKKF